MRLPKTTPSITMMNSYLGNLILGPNSIFSLANQAQLVMPVNMTAYIVWRQIFLVSENAELFLLRIVRLFSQFNLIFENSLITFL